MLQVIAHITPKEFEEKYRVKIHPNERDRFISLAKPRTDLKTYYFVWLILSVLVALVPMICLITIPGLKKNDDVLALILIIMVVGILSFLMSLLKFFSDSAMDYTKSNIDTHITTIFEEKIERLNFFYIRRINYMLKALDPDQDTISHEKVKQITPDVIVLCKFFKITYMEDLFELFLQVKFIMSVETPPFIPDMIGLCQLYFEVEKTFVEIWNTILVQKRA